MGLKQADDQRNIRITDSANTLINTAHSLARSDGDHGTGMVTDGKIFADRQRAHRKLANRERPDRHDANRDRPRRQKAYGDRACRKQTEG